MYLGLDLGTSGLKALLMDAEGRIIATSNAELSVERPQPGWSEQDADSWISACGLALDELAHNHGKEFAATQGIGLSGQMHGATLLDEQDRPLRPCILWNDTRSHEEAAELDTDTDFRKIAGNIVFPGFTAPKLCWVRNNEAGVFEATRKVLLPKDYLRLWLTGEYVSDMSDAAGTAWLDVGGRKWSDTLLEKSGMRTDQMPGLVEGSQPSGGLRAELASRWGIKAGTVVAGGGGDNAASAAGIGAVSGNDAFVSLGTSGVLFVANDAYLPKPESAVHAFCHAFPDTWHQMGVILSATDALNWYAKLVAKSASTLTDALGDSLNAPSPVTFLPYLSGERTPHNDASIRGMFAGISHADDQEALTKAVLQGVAFALCDNLDALKAAGSDLGSVIAVGGGSRSTYWLEMIATVLNLPVEVPADGDFGAAYGAARLGQLAAEGSNPKDVCTKPKIVKTIEPAAHLTTAYEAAYASFSKLYPAVRGLLS